MDFDFERLSAQFDKAVSFVSGSGISDVDLQLKLYGYFKQASVGQCDRPKPPIYDLKGRKKWYAWSEMGSMSKVEAMAAYVNLVSSVHPDFGTEKSGWVTVSTFANDERPLADNEKTISDWVKDGDLDMVKRFTGDVNVNDTMGMAPIHWASDRGDVDVLKYLVEERSAGVDFQDGTGQTALHYAVSCSHEHVCRYLIGKGARTDIQDEDGVTALQMCSDEKLKSILSSSER